MATATAAGDHPDTDLARLSELAAAGRRSTVVFAVEPWQHPTPGLLSERLTGGYPATEYVLTYVTARGVFRGWLVTRGDPADSSNPYPHCDANLDHALRFPGRATAETVAAVESALVRRFAHRFEVDEAPPPRDVP